MALVTYQPSDETADTGLQTAAGTYTDVAQGPTKALFTKSVKFTYTWQLDVSADSSAGTASATATIEYTTDGGSSWSVLQTKNVVSTGTGPVSDTGSGTNTVSSVFTGTFDLSKVDMQGEVILSYTGDGTGSGRAQITDWEVEILAPVYGIIGD